MSLPKLYAVPRPDVTFSGPAAARLIVHEVARKYGLSLRELVGRDQTINVAAPRQEAYARLRAEVVIRNAPPSYPRIGRWMGGRDHSTVMHGIRRHEERMGRAE